MQAMDVFSAAASGNLRALEGALNLHPQTINSVNPNHPKNFTPLLAAAQAGQIAAVRMLAERGADVTARDKGSKTALHHLAFSDRGLVDVYEVTRILIKKGADVNAVDKHKETPLHKAADGNCAVWVRVLLTLGASPNVKNDTNKTPLEWTIEREDCPKARALLENPERTVADTLTELRKQRGPGDTESIPPSSPAPEEANCLVS